jgi:hypothetical protein
METTARRLAGSTLAVGAEDEVSARQLILERDLVVRTLSPLLVDLTLWHSERVSLAALANLVRRSPDLFAIYIHASCSIDSHSLFWFLYEELGPGVLRSHRDVMQSLAVGIPEENLLFPEAGLPEGLNRRIS